MKTTLLTLLLVFASGAAAAAPEMGTSAGHDLDALWRTAQETYDLEREDAVLLLESRHVTVSDDGALATRVHRVVWIGTSRGIREYADLRVPWNSATSTLDVEVLRTWMDDRWWPDAREISGTAVVHTLPYAVDHADDYTSMRETMLLHDGVELPCIMETAYTIAEQGSPAAGADDVFVFPQRDPAVLAEYVVRVPAGANVHVAPFNGATAPKERNSGGVKTLTWQTENTPALKLPRTDHPERYEPAVAWSTWESWADLAASFNQSFAAAAVVGDALGDSLEAAIRPAAGPRDRTAAVVAFVEENVRTIHYDSSFWKLAPRSADRVWETGYGHVLDKAVLTAALLERAGFAVTPAFLGAAGPEPLATVPCFGALGDLLLRARFDMEAIWPNLPHLVDPARGAVHSQALVQGRPWFLFEEDPWHKPVIADGSMYVLNIGLEPADGGGWMGTAQLDADFLLDHGDAASGGGILAHMESVVASVLPGATVANARPQTMLLYAASTVVDVTLPASEEERIEFVLGRPHGGLLDALPGDVHLFDAAREAPVHLGTDLAQMVILQLRVGEREAVHVPAERTVVNAAGTFELGCTVEDGWVRFARTLEVNDTVPAGAWPELRALLLEETDAGNGTIILE